MSFPTSALRGIRSQTTMLRRATAADAPAMRRVYAAVAATGSCLLTRDGAAFDISGQELIGSFDGVTLAVDQSGAVVGYAGWNRGVGYGPSASLRVVELLALTGDGYRGLLSALGGFEAVTPTIRIRTSGADPIHWLIPGAGWAVHDVQPYMLRVVDLAGAVAARGWPSGVTADLVLELEDPVCPWNSGRHRLVIDEGNGRIDSAPVTGHRASAVTTLTPRGLALLFAGDVRSADLRRADLVDGGNAGSASVLDAAFAGPRPAILDYF